MSERCNHCRGELEPADGVVATLRCADCGREIPAAALERCTCGCGRLRRPGSRYHDYERCRQRAYRNRVRTAAAAAGLPASISLEAVQAVTHPQARNGDAQNGRRASRARRKPDLRISYRRAVDAVAELPELADLPRAHARERAQDALRLCLPPRLKDAA